MIDIHSHVLYGLDDGAKTLEDSLAMIRMAALHGTTDLVATPHADLSFRFDPQLVAERMAEVTKASEGAVKLHSGCDFHLSYDNIEDAIAHPSKYTINGKRYLMVEFSNMVIFKNTDETFERMQEAGMTPVITHPERNPLLRQRIEQIAHWVEMGVCVQLTAQSLIGEFGRKSEEFSRVLLDSRLVHFVASDGHDCEKRPPRLDLAHGWLTKNYSPALAEALCVVNPRTALAGEPLDLLDMPISEPRRWYQIWR